MVNPIHNEFHANLTEITCLFAELYEICNEIQVNRLHSSNTNDFQVNSKVVLVRNYLEIFEYLKNGEIIDVLNTIQKVIDNLINFNRQYENAFVGIQGPGNRIDIIMGKINEVAMNLISIRKRLENDVIDGC